jgi:hypothetical protein
MEREVIPFLKELKQHFWRRSVLFRNANRAKRSPTSGCLFYGRKRCSDEHLYNIWNIVVTRVGTVGHKKEFRLFMLQMRSRTSRIPEILLGIKIAKLIEMEIAD